MKHILIAAAIILLGVIAAVPVSGVHDTSQPQLAEDDVTVTVNEIRRGVLQQTGQPVTTNALTSASQKDKQSEIVLLDFLQIPMTKQQRTERGFRIYPVDDSNRVRVEVFMGEQPTGGHNVSIQNIARRGNTVNISVVFTHPDPGDAVTAQKTYPSAAAEFELPDGEYTVNVHIEEQHATQLNVDTSSD